jgi:hypothetical protein
MMASKCWAPGAGPCCAVAVRLVAPITDHSASLWPCSSKQARIGRPQQSGCLSLPAECGTLQLQAATAQRLPGAHPQAVVQVGISSMECL